MTSIPDLLITNGQVVSVTTGEVFESDVVVTGDTITALPEPGTVTKARRIVDADRLVIVPGFIDAHMHIESSMLVPSTFAEATLSRGTTTVLADPHEIVNVAGADALRWMIAEGAHTQQSQFWAVPSCVPSLDGLETAGAELSAADIDELLALDQVIALGEVMDYRAVVGGATRTKDILEVARRRGVVIDGHCPNLAGDELQRYLLAGIDSDHCKNDVEPLAQKLRLGMTMMLQEKSFTPEAVAWLNSRPVMPDFCIVTDDIAADAIDSRGHLDHLARTARASGLPTMAVLRALTLHPARRLRLHDRGIVAPGRRADLVLLSDLETFEVADVIVGGHQVEPQPATHRAFTDSVRLDPEAARDLTWRVDLPDGDHVFRAIRVNSVDTSTIAAEILLQVVDGEVRWEGRCARVSVLERYTGSGRIAHAPVLGMNLSEGAVCTSYAHDSHNITVIATTTEAAQDAAARVIHLGGGIVVLSAAGSAELALPIGGVMTDAPLSEVSRGTGEIRSALDTWGWKHRIPFMSISTLTLPVSPALKISDRGVIDVIRRSLVSPTVR